MNDGDAYTHTILNLVMAIGVLGADAGLGRFENAL